MRDKQKNVKGMQEISFTMEAKEKFIEKMNLVNGLEPYRSLTMSRRNPIYCYLTDIYIYMYIYVERERDLESHTELRNGWDETDQHLCATRWRDLCKIHGE